MEELERKILEKKWFYKFKLPSGNFTESYLPEEKALIHDTRLYMMKEALASNFNSLEGLRCVDLACHQGYFSLHMALSGADVLGVDARVENLEEASLIKEVYGLSNLNFVQSDIFDLDTQAMGTFDVVLMLGLIYHLENPIGALRIARQLTKKVCLIETQVAPNLSGIIDWGDCRFKAPMMGSFAIIDEPELEKDKEAGVTGIALCPSLDGLVWTLERLGFSRVEILNPPEGSYEQLASGMRVMVAAYLD